MTEGSAVKRRGRPPGAKNKTKVETRKADSIDLETVKPPEIVMPKAPNVPNHRKGAGYITGWRLLEETLAILPASVMQRISTSNEIDLLIQRVQGLIDKIQPGESAETWNAMKQQMYLMEKSRRSGD